MELSLFSLHCILNPYHGELFVIRCIHYFSRLNRKMADEPFDSFSCLCN